MNIEGMLEKRLRRKRDGERERERKGGREIKEIPPYLALNSKLAKNSIILAFYRKC